MEHIPVGTKVALSTDHESGQFACSGVITSLSERPFVWIRAIELLPALAKRRHKRISVNLPMFCSVVEEDGSMTVIYDGKRENGNYDPPDLTLSAGGFKLKTPFKVKDETMAIAVFFSPDNSEWMVPVFSRSVYSLPSPVASNYQTGFRFSMINSRDRRKIESLVEEYLQTNTPSSRSKKYPSCLLRMRNAMEKS
jgi:hypothetical protein